MRVRAGVDENFIGHIESSSTEREIWRSRRKWNGDNSQPCDRSTLSVPEVGNRNFFFFQPRGTRNSTVRHLNLQLEINEGKGSKGGDWVKRNKFSPTFCGFDFSSCVICFFFFTFLQLDFFGGIFLVALKFNVSQGFSLQTNFVANFQNSHSVSKSLYSSKRSTRVPQFL